jgi:hypothetical protein
MKRVIMFKLPEFPSVDFSALDLNALRESELAKRLSAFDTDKVTAALRDAAYLTVGLGVVALQRAQEGGRKLVDANERLAGQAREFTAVARQQVRGLIRTAA